MILPSEPARYEIKLPCPTPTLPQVRAWIQLHPAHWRTAYPSRQVNNVYFDTNDYSCLHDNLDGIAERSKLRLRWYGPALHAVDEARLELKRRQGAVGTKEVRPLDVAFDLAEQSWRDVHRVLLVETDHSSQRWLHHFTCPVLINHYWREYLVAADNSLRLTIDTELCAYDQRYSDRPNLNRPIPLADRIVVELKAVADREPFGRLVEALSGFPIRPDRHSKYVSSMLAGVDLQVYRD